jgi:exosome complex component RRP46
VAYNSNTSPGNIIEHATHDDIQRASSVHVLGFTSNGELLLVESEGSFSMEQWEEVYEAAQKICYGDTSLEKAENAGLGKDNVSVQDFVTSALHAKVQTDLHWKF